MRAAISLALSALVAIVVVSVNTEAVDERRIIRETEASLDETGRYVDMSVRLRVVRKDPDGRRLLADCPLMTLAYERHLGGMVDLWARDDEGKICPRLVAKGKNPAVWFCSEAMAPLILHEPSMAPWILCTGGMGASKTTSLAQWVFCRVLKHLGHVRQIGVIAPTDKRMGRVIEAIGKLWRPEWMVGGRLVPTDRDGLLRFRACPEVMFVSAHKQSEAEGTRLAGYNWTDAAPDEMQDYVDEWQHILARIRSAPDHLPAQVFATCTAKENTAWRNFKASCVAAGSWHIVRVPGIDSPFIPQLHWDRMRNGGVTPRAWKLIAMAEDVPPESAVYHCFTRTLDDGTPGNLRPIPLGAIDVTAQELTGSSTNAGLLIGHDPGKRQHVSVFLKAYRFKDDIRRGDMRPRWFVVDEVTSPDSTIRHHAQEVLKRARDEWNCNTLDRRGRPDPDAAQVVVRIDPHSRAEKSDHPGRDVYTIWRSLGMTVRAAAYKHGIGPAASEPAQIPRASRIDMMNTLLCATSIDSDDGLRRLFIACDDTGKAKAPRLLAALESMERNAGGEAEQEKKDADDLSHWPCACGYALWSIEHPRLEAAA